MELMLGRRIAQFRRERGLTQDQLAEQFGVSPQAVSKWENDQACPDVMLLPQIADYFGVPIDSLFRKQELTVTQLPVEERKNLNQMLLRIIVDSADGDKVKVNLPMSLVKVGLEIGMQMPHISGTDALKDIDFAQIFSLVEQGVIGRLVEVESAEGDTVLIEVE